LVGDKGEQLGIMTPAQAVETARKRNLDLVEVAPTSVPPVCRLMDYGKFKYEQSKKDREARKGQKISVLREVRLRPKIGVHDFDAKARSARKLLLGGDKVKLTIMFRGREITHPELGWRLLQKMAGGLKDIAVIDRQPAMDNRRMILIVAPIAADKIKTKTDAKPAPKPAPKTESSDDKNAAAATDTADKADKIIKKEE
jgi:translation initiation factor IF-3